MQADHIQSSFCLGKVGEGSEVKQQSNEETVTVRMLWGPTIFHGKKSLMPVFYFGMVTVQIFGKGLSAKSSLNLNYINWG